MAKQPGTIPLVDLKDYQEPSLFTPTNLLREARRQKALSPGVTPEVCVLDPDGDILRWLVARSRAVKSSNWACYHTDLYESVLDDVTVGIVPGAVGASFAVLVAEELFASGCRLLISITSAGQILAVRPPPYFVLIEKAIRDEGTSYHYLPPSPHSSLNTTLLEYVTGACADAGVSIEVGVSWTTDAPFRETSSLIAHHRSAGVLTVEMEAAALYAFAEARRKQVVCFAVVTNQMASREFDFEKGGSDGFAAALRLIALTAQGWRAAHLK